MRLPILLVLASLIGLAIPTAAQPSFPLRTGAARSVGLNGGVTVRPSELAPLAVAPGDERWDDRFGKPGTGFYTYAAAAAPDGNVYVGGYFSQAGGVPINRIARWDGRRFHPLGSGLDGSVYALAIGADGSVYAGGDFVNAGTVRVNGVARWDPAAQTWSALAGGVTDSFGGGDVIYALAVRGGDLFVGGNFERAGGNPAIRGVARWNGTTWSALGAGIGNNFGGGFTPSSSTVSALAVSGASVFVGGQFGAVDAGQANGIARWDVASGTWSTLAGGTTAAGSGASAGTVNALAVDGTGLYVAGTFARAGAVAASNVARWDGAAWSALGSGIEGRFGAQVQGLAVAGGALYATGNFDTAGGQQARRVAKWQNGAWAEVDGGLDGTGRFATAAPDGVYIGGEFAFAGSTNAGYIARWTGNEWRALGLGVQFSSIAGSVAAIVQSGGLVYAAGQFTHVGGRPALNIAEWNGTDWRALGSGLNGTVSALAVGPDGHIYAGGAFTTAGGGSANYVARWNPGARTWSPLSSGASGSVSALLFRGPDLFVGGSFSSAGAVAASNVARWNGAAWSALGAGVNARVLALATSGANLIVGGELTRAGGLPAAGVAQWDGTAWSALGMGVQRSTSSGSFPGTVRALAVSGGQVYAGGKFDVAGNAVAPGVARWDGAAWSALGASIGGLNQEVFALASAGVNLYVGGSFATAGGATVNSVARWDGTAWSALGSGLTADTFTEADALLVNGNDLFVGGRYIRDAGGRPASAFTSYRIEAAPPPPNVTVVRDFDPAGPQIVWLAGTTQPQGFVFGTNRFGDRAKGVLLAVPAALSGPARSVTEVRVTFAYKRPNLGDRMFTLRLYNGTAQGGPTGAPLYSQSYRLADVNADADVSTPEAPTVLTLNQPVQVSGSFFVVVDYGAYDPTAPTDLATIAASNLVGARVSTVWEQLSDGTWVNMSDSWFGQGGAPGANGWRMWAEAVLSSGTTADDPTSADRSGFALLPATPNPFRGMAVVRYEIPAAGHVQLRAYDALGREVAVLVDEDQPAGSHTAQWSAHGLAGGVYLLRLDTSGARRTQRVTVSR